jgi:hypothetical protein
MGGTYNESGRRAAPGVLIGEAMNIQSEIEYFSDLNLLDKARFLTLLIHELSEEAKGTYGPGAEQVSDAAHLRFINELHHRLSRVVYQILGEDPARPADEVLIRMLLSPRADKTAERFVTNAYRRSLQGFDRQDTTVLMSQ